MSIRRLLAGLAALVALPSAAADWSFDPSVGVSYEYNDNNRLSSIPGTEIQTSGGKLDAAVGIRAATPRSELVLTPRLRSTFYPGEETEEADDEFVHLFAQFLTDRTTSAFNAYYSLVDTLGDYFPNATVTDDDALGDPDRGVGVGRTTQSNREDRLDLRPEFTFQLSPKHTLQVRLGYLDVAYDTQVPGDRVDYEDLALSVELGRALTSTSSILVRGGWSTFDPLDADSTDAQALTAEWRNEISDTAEVFVRGGANRIESLSDDGSSTWDTGFAGGAGVRWSFEVTDVWFDASTDLDPNPSGDMVTRNQARVQLTHRLSPLTTLRAGIRAIDDAGAGDAEDTFADQTYATANLGFDWRIAPTWTVFALYNYSWSEYDDSDSDAESNSLSLGITWKQSYK